MPQPSTLTASARYVALGSSFAAGPGIGARAPGTPRRAAEVHRRAPGCRLIFVDYLTLLPPDAITATGALPAEVAAWGRGVARRLSEVTRAAAENFTAEGARCDFAPAGAASENHHAWSAAPWTRRFHLGLRDGASYHPNAAGMAAVASLVADIITEQAGPARRSR